MKAEGKDESQRFLTPGHPSDRRPNGDRPALGRDLPELHISTGEWKDQTPFISFFILNTANFSLPIAVCRDLTLVIIRGLLLNPESARWGHRAYNIIK